MKKGLLVLMMLLIACPAFALPVTLPEADSSSGIKLDIGGDVRLRGYDMDNFWDFNNHSRDTNSDGKNDSNGDDWAVFRLRTRLYTKATLSDNVSGYVRFGNQTWGENVMGAEGKTDGQGLDENVFADNAYMDLTNLFGQPVDLRIGRQDMMMYGTGFVIMDGEPDVGSTCFYFDGIKATWRIAKSAKVEAFYLKDEENVRADRPNAAKFGSGDDINLMGAYLTAQCPVMGGQQEVYLLNRTDDLIDKDIFMGGLRLSRTFDFGLNYSAEAAYQWGDAYRNQTTFDVLDQSAMGCKLEVGYAIPTDAVKLRPFIAYTSMSGDKDAGDDDFEGWDVFYGGWPQFGDLLSFVYINKPNYYHTGYSDSSSVSGECIYSNLNLATLATDITVGKVKATVGYTKLTANDVTTLNANFNQDNDYGDYYTMTISYPYTKNVTFALEACALEPGDAFPDTNDSMAREVYWETNLKF